MIRSILIVCILCHTVPSVALAAGGDAVSQHAWIHVTGRPEPAGFSPEELGTDEETLLRFREAEHPFVELLDRHVIRLNIDGTITTTRVLARQFLTAEGVRNHGNLFETVNAAAAELYLDHASLRMPDGTTRSLDLNRAQVTTSDAPSVFTDLYHVVLPLEGLVPGATALLATRTLRQADRWPLPWSVIFATQRPVPIQRMEVELSWDEGVDAPIWSTDAELVECEATGRRLRCRAQDVPALVFDPESPNINDDLPLLVLAEKRTWNEVALAEADLVTGSTRQTGHMKPLLDRLLAGAGTNAERLRRLHRFVADEIRYVALSHGTSAVVPAPVARTLDRRYGDCKDKVAAFLALAREAGLRADPVLVATSHSSVDKLILPSPQYFDHMIACVHDVDVEGRTCIDLTAPGMRTGDLPLGLYGRVALDLIDETAGPRLLEAPPFVWEIDLDVTNRMGCDGTLTETLRRSFRGPGGGQMRAVFSGLSPEDRERWAVEDYQDVMGDAIDPKATIGGLDSPDGAFTLETTTEYELGPVDELTEYGELESWLVHYAGWFETENESRHYTLPGVRIRSTSIFELCPEHHARFVGPALKLVAPFGALRRRYDAQGSRVEVVTELRLPSATIRDEDLDGFRRFLNHALAQTLIWFDMKE